MNRSLRRSVSLSLSLMLLSTASAVAQGVSPKTKAALSAKYPGEEAVASCSAGAVGNRLDGFAALYNSSDKQTRVVAIDKEGGVRELDVIPSTDGSSFELQCLNAKEAKERKKVLRESETIRDFLHVPTGRGAVCYFTSDTETKCWSTDKDGKLIDVGGWQT